MSNREYPSNGFMEFRNFIESSTGSLDECRECAWRMEETVGRMFMDHSPMTHERAQQHAHDYMSLTQALYESDVPLDVPFVVGRSRREQAHIWMSLADGAFEAMNNLTENGDEIPRWLSIRRNEMAVLHNSRYQAEPPMRGSIVQDAA